MSEDIESSMRFYRSVKIAKIILAICLVAAYLFDSQWFEELMIVAIIFSLVLPLGFFDVFIQKLLEYNTRLVEERQQQNAVEANKVFTSMNNRIERIEDQVL